MPYKKARYRHYRQRNPREFRPGTFRTVPLSHANYRGKKFSGFKNAKAVVGKRKKDGKWVVQSILIPK